MDDWEDDFELSPADKELAEDLSIEIMHSISEYSLDVRYVAIVLCQFMLDQEEKEQMVRRANGEINGVNLNL